MAMAAFASMAAGVTMPLMNVVFGRFLFCKDAEGDLLTIQ